MDALLAPRRTGGQSSRIVAEPSVKGGAAERRELEPHLAAATSSVEFLLTVREPTKYLAIALIAKTGGPVPQPLPSQLHRAVDDAEDRILAAEIIGADMGPVDNALQQAILEASRPPSAAMVPVDQRRVEVRLAVLRDGAVRDAIVHENQDR